MRIEEMSSTYEVRRLTMADIPAIHQLCKSNPEYYRHMKMQPTQEKLAEVLTVLPPGRTIDEKYFVGFYEQQTLVALMDLVIHHPTPEVAFIGWFMVDMAYQNRGVGRHLVAELAEFLGQNGFRYIRLGYVKGNKESEGFWMRNGFVPTGKEYEQDQYTVVLMERRISV